jgi:hypothetical protein
MRNQEQLFRMMSEAKMGLAKRSVPTYLADLTDTDDDMNFLFQDKVVDPLALTATIPATTTTTSNLTLQQTIEAQKRAEFQRLEQERLEKERLEQEQLQKQQMTKNYLLIGSGILALYLIFKK